MPLIRKIKIWGQNIFIKKIKKLIDKTFRKKIHDKLTRINSASVYIFQFHFSIFHHEGQRPIIDILELLSFQKSLRRYPFEGLRSFRHKSKVTSKEKENTKY